MVNLFYLIFILLFIILFYFHLSAQFKKPKEPFDIYQTTYESKKQIDNLNLNKQPFLFEIDLLCPLTFSTNIDELDCFVSLINIEKYNNINTTVLEVPLKKGIHITNNLPNYTCLGNISLNIDGSFNTINEELNDILLPESIIITNKLGIMFGSIDSHSIPEYHTQTSKYLIILNGEITVKLISIRNFERLNGGKCKQKTHVSQYTQFYGDHINLWDTENIKLQKIPILEFNVTSGFALSIPSYMIWTISYNNPNTIVLTVDYISFINSVANIINFGYSQYTSFCKYQNNPDIQHDQQNDLDIDNKSETNTEPEQEPEPEQEQELEQELELETELEQELELETEQELEQELKQELEQEQELKTYMNKEPINDAENKQYINFDIEPDIDLNIKQETELENDLN